MTQNAVVTKVINTETAEVTVSRNTACGSCRSSCVGCMSGKKIAVLAANDIAAVVGDRVVVYSRTGKILKTAAFVYLLPLCALFAGYAVSAIISVNENISIITGLLSFFLGISTISVSRRFSRRSDNSVCEIKEIIR